MPRHGQEPADQAWVEFRDRSYRIGNLPAVDSLVAMDTPDNLILSWQPRPLQSHSQAVHSIVASGLLAVTWGLHVRLHLAVARI